MTALPIAIDLAALRCMRLIKLALTRELNHSAPALQWSTAASNATML